LKGRINLFERLTPSIGIGFVAVYQNYTDDENNTFEEALWYYEFDDESES